MAIDDEHPGEGRMVPEPWRPEPAPSPSDPYYEDPYYPDPYASF